MLSRFAPTRGGGGARVWPCGGSNARIKRVAAGKAGPLPLGVPR